MDKKHLNPISKASTNYVVGIGASAGGLEAIHDLFDYMPENTNFSFIVIQHLSPDYKSLMADLLSRHTKMSVQEAQDDMAVEPNCIYVIPTKKLMTIRDGRLRLDEKLKSHLPNNAIDIFLKSLAEDCKENAIAIILSGTGTDGTKGIEDIKNHGGVVIVQDPLSAGFDGMPNSAIASGFADLILPPEMIGEELVQYTEETPLLKSLSKLNQKDESTLQEIIELLHAATHRDFTHYKRPTLFRRLAKRMSEIGISAIHDYKNHLIANTDELKALSKEFLINVTKFFRDEEAFEILKKEAVPSIVNGRKQDEAIKVWVAACSSGEEAYSVAILFLEFFEKAKTQNTNLKIFATDIDSDALEIASRGLYHESISKDVSPQRLQNYFVREGNMYRVSGELRKHVVFANHDILKDPPFSHLNLITCRNMFIYINPLLQQKILKKFHFALSINSYLMMGPSENIELLKDSMQEINRKWKIYKCVNKATQTDHSAFMIPLEKGSVYPVTRTTANSRNLLNHLAEIFKDTLLEGEKIAAIFIDKDFNIKQAIGSYKHFLHFPEENFNFNLLKLVSGDLAVALGVSVRKAISQHEKVISKRVALHQGNTVRYVTITVKPYLQQKEFQQAFLCVILEEEMQLEVKTVKVISDQSEAVHERIKELEQELVDTRENLQAIIEEMETAGEELQASNEEMISTNEELQSTNEELQSLNEELHTVSGEHQLKIKELHELNDDLNNYFNNSNVGQLLIDNNLIIRKFSPIITKMINVIETDIGRSIADITTKIKNIDFVNDIKQVLQTSVALEREITINTNQFYLMRITPYIRRDKTTEGIVINFTDISESKKLNSIISSVFNSSPNAITVQQAVRNEHNKIIDFVYVALNEAAASFYEINHSYIVGKRFLDVLPIVNRDLFNLYVNVVENDKEANFEFFHSRANKWYQINAVKMLDGLVATHTDITEQKANADTISKNYDDLQDVASQLKKSNIQLERSNLDLLQFASVASHDLKEPLRKIQAFGNVLLSKVKDKLTEDEMNYFNKMIMASGRMQKLIEDVLSLSKLSDNNIKKEKVDLTEMNRKICDDLEISIKEKKAVIDIGELPVIVAIPWQIQQLFQNLIINSLKFCNKEDSLPHILIRKKAISDGVAKDLNIAAKDFVCVSVKDNGIGFENEYSDKIFGIFQRLHGRGYEGTGIGLAIARKIVENHGGYIRATGELNKGAEFSIYLPSLN